MVGEDENRDDELDQWEIVNELKREIRKHIEESD